MNFEWEQVILQKNTLNQDRARNECVDPRRIFSGIFLFRTCLRDCILAIWNQKNCFEPIFRGTPCLNNDFLLSSTYINEMIFKKRLTKPNEKTKTIAALKRSILVFNP